MFYGPPSSLISSIPLDFLLYSQGMICSCAVFLEGSAGGWDCQWHCEQILLGTVLPAICP